MTNEVHFGEPMHKSSLTRMAVAAVAGVSLIALAGCSGTSSSGSASASANKPSSYSIGAALPLSGSAAATGADFQRGVQTAVDELNAGGGIGGVKVDLNIQDNLLTAAGSVTAMNQMLANGTTQAVIMTSSAGVTATAPLATKSKVLMMNPGGEDPTLQKLSPYLVSNIPNIATEINTMLPYLKSKGYKRMAMYAEGDALGATTSAVAQAKWTSLGGTWLGSEQEPITVVDHSSVISKIKSENPDIIYVLAGGQQSGTFIKQARDQGLKTQMVGATPLNSGDLTTLAGDAAEGILDSTVAPALDTKGNSDAAAYSKQFLKKYPTEDPSNVYSIFGHDAVMIWAQAALALQKSGTDYNGDNLLKQIQKTKTFKLAGGTTEIASDGSSLGAITFTQYTNGKFVPFKTVSAADVAKDQK
jgi:branched-chain amino acid transport system substrate-binding protein